MLSSIPKMMDHGESCSFSIMVFQLLPIKSWDGAPARPASSEDFNSLFPIAIVAGTAEPFFYIKSHPTFL